MAATEPERRRFVTRHDIEDAARTGRSVQLRARDVLTDEAAQRARDLGVGIERQGGAGTGTAAAGRASPGTDRPSSPQAPPPSLSAAASAGGAPPSGAASTEQLRRAVRAAVVAELGHQPAGLDAAIDRVLARRGR